MHKAFKLELYAAVTTKTPKLSDVFIRYKTKLLVYGDFCSNLPKAQARIDELCQNEAIRLKIQVGVGRVRINRLFLVFYRLISSLPWCHLKTTSKSGKFETFISFLASFFALACEKTFITRHSIKSRCYRTRKYTGCGHVPTSFSPEIL